MKWIALIVIFGLISVKSETAFKLAEHDKRLFIDSIFSALGATTKGSTNAVTSQATGNPAVTTTQKTAENPTTAHISSTTKFGGFWFGLGNLFPTAAPSKPPPSFNIFSPTNFFKGFVDGIKKLFEMFIGWIANFFKPPTPKPISA